MNGSKLRNSREREKKGERKEKENRCYLSATERSREIRECWLIRMKRLNTLSPKTDKNKAEVDCAKSTPRLIKIFLEKVRDSLSRECVDRLVKFHRV